MLLTIGKYTTLSLICLVAMGLAMNGLLPHIFGLLALAGWIILTSFSVSKRKIFLGLHPTWFWTLITVISSLVITESAIYYLAASTPNWILVGFTILTTLFLPGKKINLTLNIETTISKFFGWFFSFLKLKRWKNWWPTATIMISQIGLTCFVYLNRTTDSAASPWPALGKEYLLMYLVVTFALALYLNRSTSSRLLLLPLIGHFFTTFSVVSIFYPLGFGYDPFIHRATERHIANFGFADPKTPFYIGQYVIINILHYLGGISIKSLDIWLVPTLSSVFLPLAMYIGAKYGLLLSDRASRLVALFSLLYPLNTMYATTPHNLANVLVLSTIFLSPIIFVDRRAILPIGILSIAAAVVHPLTGILAIATVAALSMYTFLDPRVQNRYARFSLAALLLLAGSVIIPLLFVGHLKLNSFPIPSVLKFPHNFDRFFELFKTPFYYSKHWAGIIWESVYLYELIQPAILIILATVGFYSLKGKQFKIYFLFFVAAVGNAFFLRTWLTIPNLDVFEERQYAERILHISIFFILPFAAAGIVSILNSLTARTKFGERLALIVAVLGLLVSYYLTYPQLNKKVYFPGFNVTAADVETAEYLHNSSPAGTYIVLSNILTAAASVERYGFETYFPTPDGQQFYFAIPSGSRLAASFNEMIYEGQKRETITNAMEYTNTKTAYFLVHSYWKNAAVIAENAKLSADSWNVIENGRTKIWVFVYRR